MSSHRLLYRLRLGILAALGFGSFAACDNPDMYGPPVEDMRLMYGPAPVGYLPADSQPSSQVSAADFPEEKAEGQDDESI